MADNIDLDSLTAHQRDVLQQYTGVTNQEVKDAIPLLRRTEWNLQIAITRFFDGEPAEDPLAEAMAAAPVDVRRQETLMHGFEAPRASQIREVDLAPRVVPQPESQATRTLQSPILLRLLFSPISLLYALLTRSLSFIGRIFPFLPRLLARLSGPPARPIFNSAGRTPLRPRDSAARFIREFEEEYGSNELPFVEDGYAQALDTAKRDLKFLLVSLASPEHDDTSSYMRETLLNPEVVAFLKNPENNILLWAGNVQDSEAFQVAEALKCTKFPFAAMICHTPIVSTTAMSVIARLTGPMPPAQFLSKLRDAMQMHSEGLTRARRTRQEQQATRNIREQQESAYERSLAADREKSRLKREEQEEARREAENQRKAEQEAETRRLNLQRWKHWRASRITPEPSADIKDAARISFRLLNGERVVRRFAADAEIEELYAFVECYDVLQGQDDGSADASAEKPEGYTHVYDFRLVSPMPREVFEVDAKGSVRQRLGRSGNLIVERIVEEQDDSDSDEE